jgi:hypothetical protein
MTCPLDSPFARDASSSRATQESTIVNSPPLPLPSANWIDVSRGFHLPGSCTRPQSLASLLHPTGTGCGVARHHRSKPVLRVVRPSHPDARRADAACSAGRDSCQQGPQAAHKSSGAILAMRRYATPSSKLRRHPPPGEVSGVPNSRAASNRVSLIYMPVMVVPLRTTSTD